MKKIIILLAILMTGLTGCSWDSSVYDDLNGNPPDSIDKFLILIGWCVFIGAIIGVIWAIFKKDKKR